MSEWLGLVLRAEGGRLHLYDRATGTRLLRADEVRAAHRAAEAELARLQREVGINATDKGSARAHDDD